VRSSMVTASILACISAAAPPPLANAQSLASRLSQLITEPSSPGTSSGQASSSTSDAITKLVRVELSSLPAPSSSAGVVYRLDPSLGIVARASQGLGPVFVERALRTTSGALPSKSLDSPR
jgi:hypothetical protein